MKKIYGFIGCGNMGGALARAVAAACGGESVLLCDTDQQKADALAQELGAASVTLEGLVGASQYIFLGVKPQGFPSLFAALRPMLQARSTAPVLVTMAAGLSLAAVEAMSGEGTPVIRIMPNMPVSAGAGMILYCTNAAVAPESLSAFLEALATAGRTDAIEEGKIDAASALSGCGPAFAYLFAEALADGAVECGLSREKASLYAAQTLYGAAKLLLESGRHPGELKDAVCSPGGTTIAGVHALEEGAFRAAAMRAVTASYEKTLLLKK